MPETKTGWKPRFKTIRACTICGSTRSLRPIRPSVKTFVRGCSEVVETKYHSCSACNFAFQSTGFDGGTWRNYYANNFQFRRTAITHEETVHLKGQSEFVASNHKFPRASEILEVGADNGSFLFLISSALAGVGYYDEFNVDARRILDGLGFKDGGAAPKKKYDLIAMRHVFEHIPFPGKYLAGLHKRLKPGGAVFIEVPDCSYLCSRYVDLLQIEHVNYFSLQSLYITAAHAGFLVKAVEFARTPNYATSPNRVLRVLLARSPEGEAVRPNRADDWDALAEVGMKDTAAFESFFRKNAGKKLALYGAGTKLMHYLANSQRSFKNVLVFDLDPLKIGKKINGAEILDSRTAGRHPFDAILLTVVGYRAEVLRALAEMNIPKSKIHFLPQEEPTR